MTDCPGELHVFDKLILWIMSLVLCVDRVVSTSIKVSYRVVLRLYSYDHIDKHA